MTNDYDRFNSWKGLIYSDKLEKIADVLKDPLNPKGKIPYPVNWHIYPSNFCQNDCNFCIMKNEKEKKAMLDSSLLEKAINDASDIGVKLIHFSGGGEPFTHPYLSNAIEYAKIREIKVALSTNGILLDSLKTPVDHLRISINAGDRETYKKIMKTDLFDRVIKNTKNAVENRKGNFIGMGFVITHENYQSLENFISVAEECGVDFVHIRPAFWPDRNGDILDATKKIPSLKSDKLKIYAISEKFDGYWNNNKYPCRATPLHAVLSATGEFLICQDSLDLRFGNYYEQTFDQIWFSKEHYDLIKKAQNCDIRCVECRLNEMIERIFIKNEVCKELI